MNVNRALCLALVAVALSGQILLAGTILGTTGSTYFPRTKSQTLSVYGDWIETIGSATSTSADVEVRIAGKFNGLQNNSGRYAGRGRVDLRITTNNASPGEKTIKLSGGLFGDGNVRIRVLESPAVTNVSVPTPDRPFKEIVVTLQGSGLLGAQSPASGTLVRSENGVNYITTGPHADVTDVQVLNSAQSNLQIKITFNNLVQDVSVDLTFRTERTDVPLINGLTRRVRLVCSRVRNFVTAITFPNGNTFDVNGVATVRLQLLYAPGGNTVRIGGVQQRVSITPPMFDSDRRVVVHVTPEVSEPVGEVLANPGDDEMTLMFKIKNCGGGSPGSTQSATVLTWMHNQATFDAPYYKAASFKVRCPQ